MRYDENMTSQITLTGTVLLSVVVVVVSLVHTGAP